MDDQRAADDPAEARARRGLPGGEARPEWEPDGLEESFNGSRCEPVDVERRLRSWGLLPGRLIRKWDKPAKELTETGLNVTPSGEKRRQYKRKREIEISSLPIFTEAGIKQESTPTRDAVRLALYGEAMSTWRTLTDVRFRLLSLLPAVSIVAFVPLILVVGTDEPWVAIAGVLLAVLGLSVTHGLHIYEQRNDGLYDDVISRARRIEAELGIETGLMLGRLAKPHARVSHGRATTWVFRSVKAAWLVVAVVLAVSALLAVGNDTNDGPTRVQLVGPDGTTVLSG